MPPAWPRVLFLIRHLGKILSHSCAALSREIPEHLSALRAAYMWGLSCEYLKFKGPPQTMLAAEWSFIGAGMQFPCKWASSPKLKFHLSRLLMAHLQQHTTSGYFYFLLNVTRGMLSETIICLKISPAGVKTSVSESCAWCDESGNYLHYNYIGGSWGQDKEIDVWLHNCVSLIGPTCSI